MGNQDFLLLTDEVDGPRSSASMLVVASTDFAQDIDQNDFAATLPHTAILELDAYHPIAPETIGQADLLVLEVDPNDRKSMQRLSSIRSAKPELTVIAAIRDSSVALVRTLLKQGVVDVVNLPFDVAELVQASLEALANRRVAAPAPIRLAPMISVASSIGGCGATSIATHLAAALARSDQSGKGVVIVDLDIQFGSVADYLGEQGRGGTISDLLEAQTRLDEELIRSTITKTGENVAIISAPSAIIPLESVDTDQLLRVLTLLRQQFGVVILDLPSGWTNWSLSATLSSDAVLLIAELSINSLRQAKRSLDLFSSVGIDASGVKIVINRVKRKLFPTITIDDVASTLGHPVLATVALDEPLVSSAQDQGELVTALQRKSHFAGDITKLADILHASVLDKGTQ